MFLSSSESKKGTIIKKRTPRFTPNKNGIPYTVVNVNGVNCQIMDQDTGEGSWEHANHLLIVPRKSKKLLEKNYKWELLPIAVHIRTQKNK